MAEHWLTWLESNSDSDGIHAIRNVFPDHFAAYYKLYLPYAICDDFPVDDYRYEPDTIENLNLRQSIGARF
ncbi:MAG: hypothetical protein AAGD05_10275, partial [Bacteroidota bacterium]